MRLPPRSNGDGIPSALRDLYGRARRPETLLAPEHVRSGLMLEKWRLIQRLLRRAPFTVSATLPRAEQWRRVRDHVRHTIGEPELCNWLTMQIDVATNIARGIHDLRPRKAGPCHDLLMEVVRDKKRKALAVHRWNLEALALDPSLDWEVTEDMLRDWRIRHGDFPPPPTAAHAHRNY